MPSFLWARSALTLLPTALFLASCRSAPPSQFPTAQAALDRLQQTYACSRGVTGEAEVDYFGDEGRFRGVSLIYTAVLTDQLRLDVVSNFGLPLSTLTADGADFSYYDLQSRTFLKGPASECNVARLTQVPVPPFVLVQLLRGEAPVLVHEANQATIAWNGNYEIKLKSKHQAEEVIVLEPYASDFDKPFSQQRLRVLEVRVAQAGIPLYTAELADHAPRALAAAWHDSDDFAPDVPPSGPTCQADVPGRIRLEVPYLGRDIVIRVKEVSQNPPLTPGFFRLNVPSGVKVGRAECR